MTTFIDVSSVLMGCGPFTNLVTRPTGAAVRSRIEATIAAARGAVTIIDFSQVALLDFSCADEVVAKLLLASAERGEEVHFLFRGIHEAHLDAIDAVLERHRLALVVQLADGAAQLHGTVTTLERRVWEALLTLAGAGRSEEIGARLGLAVDECRNLLESLCSKRVVLREGVDRYLALGHAA